MAETGRPTCRETPVRGAMGFRLLVNQRKTGALNLFSDTPNSFNKESAGQAIVLGAFASVAINAIAQGEDAATMRRGLASNREIGKAVGMLMMLHGFSEDDAFALLRRHSQHLNIKLADVARQVIERRGVVSATTTSVRSASDCRWSVKKPRPGRQGFRRRMGRLPAELVFRFAGIHHHRRP